MKHGREEPYKYIVNNLSDAVYIYSLVENKFTSLNPAGQTLTGYTEKELLRFGLGKLIAPEYQELVQKMIAQKSKKDLPTIYEIEIIRKDGSRIPVEISSRATYSGGKPVEVLGIARDISERKHTEKQKEIFLSLITHELKNPLTSIKMYTDLLERTEKNKQKLTYFDTMQNQITALTMLMNDFLEVSKIRVGRFSVEKERFNLDDVVRDAVYTFKTTDATHKIARRGTIDLELIGDKNRIRQVIVNLISNAIKYSPQAKRVLVSVKRDTMNAVVQVRDYGIGIPKQDYKKIFELFYRTAFAEKGNIKGHGLGLFICREIIKSHNGSIWVKSILGKGSTFYFTLPITTDKKIASRTIITV
jgi:PAS domain S-box-containing protein